MSPLEKGDASILGDVMFSWGHKEPPGDKNLNRQYYRSFTYDGVEYLLYDTVYLWAEGQPSPHIGKIVKIFETPHLEKKVKVVWYFRPSEVEKWLKGTRVLHNELFLASGQGLGLFNINALETISGKCNVICTSNDGRNPKASMEGLKMSTYVFSRTFDVKECRISEIFPDKIAGVPVGHFFNPKPKENSKVTVVKDLVLRIPTSNVGKLTSSSSSASDSCHPKKRKLLDFESNKGENVEKKRPTVDSSNWFKTMKLPWEERMQKARETGSLVLLENLYTSFTSLDVEEIVMDAFNMKVSAKMVRRTAFSSPYIGKAFVVFGSKGEADFAISELNTKCLIVGDTRPIIGSRPSLREPGNHPSQKFGYIRMDSMRYKRQWMEQKKGGSTSHFSQPNTVEFDMAMEWRTLQEKSELWWDALFKQQAKEIANLRDCFKSTPTISPKEI
uniref:protein ANTI-SILENCING 1-like n=1 Tax=Erigeron canadensis TaxID=72917 RepID=UPI001CB9AFD0|nr:protein ANTI-SILENCING 1-like [Erigeron canadensis]